MKKLFVIGIGTGNPGHLSMQAVSALNRTHVIFIPTKGDEKAALKAARTAICDRYVSKPVDLVEYAIASRNEATGDYTQRVIDWHDVIAESYVEMFSRAPQGSTGALLVWGDPGLYDSTLRIIEAVKARSDLSFEVEVVPGITAIAALTAAFAIPLNTIGNPVTITTGRKLSGGWPQGADTVVVMLDGTKTFASIDPAGLYIYWAAYAGMDEQILIQGPLEQVRDQISAARDAARTEHGWIMDIYLLRKG